VTTDGSPSPLTYEAPLERGGGKLGSLAYAFRDGGVTVTAPYDEPLGRGRWVGHVAMALGVAAVALFVAAQFGGTPVRRGFGPVRVTSTAFALWGGALMLAAFALRPVATAIARGQRQRVVIDAGPDRLTVRTESLLGGHQEARAWDRDELSTVIDGDGAVVVHARDGGRYALEAGRDHTEREWLATTLRGVLRLPDPRARTRD
jgi:hypothetical protein